MENRIETSPNELFALIGEREFIKFKQAEEIQKLYTQINEMSKTIDELRKEIEDFKKPKLVRQDG